MDVRCRTSTRSYFSDKKEPITNFVIDTINIICTQRGISAAKLGSALNNSVLTLSKPGVFPFFNALIAEMISCLDDGLVSMSKSAVALCV